MSDGSPALPGWGLRVFDYVGLGFLLLVAEQLWQHPMAWYSWGGALLIGVVCLWFGEAAPITRKKLREKWGASKALAAARAENATLKQQLENARRFDAPQGTASLSAILSPLQIEALSIAKDLRDFLASLPPFPSDTQQNPNESDYDYITRIHGSSEGLQKLFAARREIQGQWRQKLFHGYANRKFGERITALMHRAGEELEYPAYVPNFAEKPPMGPDDVKKLAQQMEMLAIWVNRKERGEINLLK